MYNSKENDRKESKKRFEKSELELMTTYQLREICRHEKIMNGIINPLDKEELIWTIMRSMGKKENLLVKEFIKGGRERIENFISKCKITYHEEDTLKCTSKIIAYKGLSIEYYDRYTISYKKELAGTNAVILGSGFQICAFINIVEHNGDKENLYLTKSAEMDTRETERKDYQILCVNKRTSDFLYHLYYGGQTVIPEHIEVYRIPIIDFAVKEPIMLTLPMAIDFGSVNTTAGVYLDTSYFERIGHEAAVAGCRENAVNYTVFEDGEHESALLPSVVGVAAVEDSDYKLLFGYDAMRLASASYIDEGFCVFYDIKRWIGEYEKEEEIVDRQGRRSYVKRADILRRFFCYVIRRTENRFKCHITQVHISSPVKQKYRFRKMFQTILPEYGINQEEMLDEGMAVLYNTISNMMEQNSIDDNEDYEALIIDCGGGTTDLCSYRFRIQDRKAAYKICMETTYENGDTDFGGNNLTYRIMQVLKIAFVHQSGYGMVKGEKEILELMDTDIYRYIDEKGIKEFYKVLDEEYQKAEEILPTRFADFERYNRSDYYKVKNNFYTLFAAAEQMKKLFYSRVGTLKITVSTDPDRRTEKTVLLDKWKLSFREGDVLNVKKTISDVEINFFEIELLLAGEVYGIIHKFMDELYESGRLQQFSFIKLTGQSCKIDLFKDALKEFVPGRMIQFRKRASIAADYELKMTCVNGALKYIKDKRYGLAAVRIDTGKAVLPYMVTAYTHNGREVVLIDGGKDWNQAGFISRNMEDLTLQMYLKDKEGAERYRFCYVCKQDDFSKRKYEEIQAIYGEHILQKETDTIENGDVKFFVWARQEEWGYQVVPVFCKEDELYLGKAKFYCFENDNWVNSFFDGRK